MFIWATKEARVQTEYLRLALVIVLAWLAIGEIAAHVRFEPYVWRALRWTYESSEQFQFGAFRLSAFVLTEEILFRALPMTLACIVNRAWFTVTVMVLASLAFGFHPGHEIFTFKTKCLIALCNVPLTILYIKGGGWSRSIEWKALVFVFFAHYVADIIGFYVLVLRMKGIL